MNSGSLVVRLPSYTAPRNTWREAIHRAVSDQMHAAGIVFTEHDRVSVDVRLFMSDSMLRFHDVDNRLKDILDALQGRAGGPKKTRRLAALIPNDHQIYRASVEKGPVPADGHLGGELRISRISADSVGAA